MNRETALTFRIDTDRPPDVPEALLRTKFVNASNQDAVEVDVRIPGSLDGDEETLLLTVGGPSRSGEMSFRRPLTAAAGDLQSVTLDLSSLPEGELSTVRAYLLDEVDNAGGYGETSQPIKDSVPPTISDFAVSADGRDLDIAFDASENVRAPTPPEYENVTVVVLDAGGTEVARLDEDDFDQNQAGSVYEYTDTLRDLPYGPYEVRLLSAVDPFGNAGNAGQSRSVYVGPNRIVEDFEEGTDLSSNLNFTGGDGGDVGIRADGTTQGGDSVGTIANSGTNAAYLGDSSDDVALVSRTLNTTGQGTVDVVWAFKEGDDTSTPDPGEGEELFVEYRDQNGNWQEIASYDPQGADRPYQFDSATLSASDALHDRFAVRFRQPSSSADDPWYVDDVCILPGGGTCPLGDSTPPTLSGLSLSRSASVPLSSPPPARSFDVTASFTADEQLSSFDATVTAPDGATTSLTEGEFTETANGDGTYTYALDPASAVAASDDGTFGLSVSNARDSAGNAASGSTTATLQYFGSYYEKYDVNVGGSDPPTADYMPDYESLTPVDSGTADEITVTEPQGEEKFGYRYFAYVYVDRAGTYTFYTDSDDGSDLAIGNEYVVTNRGDHGSRERSGTYDFPSAGWYNLTVRYYENTGNNVLDVEYEDPDGNRGPIPETDLVPRTPSAVGSGFQGIVDDFDDSTDFADTNWSVVGSNRGEVTIESGNDVSSTTPNAVHVADVGSGGGGIQSDTLDTDGLSEVSVSLAVKQGEPGFFGDEPDAGEDLLVQIRDRNDDWVTERTVQATGSEEPYQRISLTLTGNEALHDNFAVRIVQERTNGFADSWFVDDVCVVADSADCPFDGAGGVADPGFAYEDANRDGLYQSGTDTRIPDSTWTQTRISYDAGSNGLVIPDSVDGGDISATRIELRGADVTVGTDLTATAEALTVRATANDGVVTVDGVAIEARGSGQTVTVEASGNDGDVSAVGTTTTGNGRVVYDAGRGLTVTGATVDNTGGNTQSITLDSGGELVANGATVVASGQLTVDAGGRLDVTNAAFESTGNTQQVSLQSDGRIDGSGLELTTEGQVRIRATGGPLDLGSAEVSSTGNGQSVALDSDGNMNLESSELSTDGQLTADLTRNNAVLYVGDAEFSDSDDTLVYSPNGARVDGRTSDGGVSKN
jgi:hypothetical protein